MRRTPSSGEAETSTGVGTKPTWPSSPCLFRKRPSKRSSIKSFILVSFSSISISSTKFQKYTPAYEPHKLVWRPKMSVNHAWGPCASAPVHCFFCQSPAHPNRYILFKHVQLLFRIKEATQRKSHERCWLGRATCGPWSSGWGGPQTSAAEGEGVDRHFKCRNSRLRPECVSAAPEAWKARLCAAGHPIFRSRAAKAAAMIGSGHAPGTRRSANATEGDLRPRPKRIRALGVGRGPVVSKPICSIGSAKPRPALVG